MIELPTTFDLTVPEDNAEYVAKLRSSYVFFAHELWKSMGWDKHHRLTRVEDDILDYAANGPDRRGILAPRLLGKSHMVAVALPLYRWLRDPQRKVIELSKSKDEARKNTMLIRSIIDAVWFLNHLSPEDATETDETVGRSRIDTTTAFELGPATPHRQPSMMTLGIGGQTQGNHAHTVIPDDIETDDNTKTIDSRDELARAVNEFESVVYMETEEEMRPAIYDKPEIVYVGTYNHEESVYIKEAAQGFEFRTWPILYPRPDQKILNLAPMLQDDLDSGRAKPGDLVFPHRFNHEYIAKKLKKGTRYFDMQHMLIYEREASDRYPLRLENIMVADLDSERAHTFYLWARNDSYQLSTSLTEPQSYGLGTDRYRRPATTEPEAASYEGTHVGIDPAGMGADSIGFAAVAALNGFLFLKKIGGLQGGYSAENLETLARWCREVRATEVFIERTQGGGMFDALFLPVLQRYYLEPGQDAAYPKGWKCSISADTKITGWAAWSQKETRIIDVLEPVLGSHRMVFDTKAAENHELQMQLTRITRQKGCLEHYDELDSLAFAVKSWQYGMSTDPEKASARSRERALEERIDAFNRRAVHALDGGPETFARKW